MNIRMREGDRRADLALMQSIASSALAGSGPRYTIHPGDLAWWVYHEDPRLAGSTSYWLWEDRGFVVLGEDEINAFTMPGEDVIPLIEWGREQRGGPGSVAWVSDSDVELTSYLRSQGNEMVSPMHAFEREVGAVQTSDGFLPGWELRSLRGEEEADNRREASHRAFESTMPDDQHLDRYLGFMRSPVYAPDRDLVAVAPDGRIAAFLIWWPDQSGIAQIEPLGTHPDFQRRGVGRALVEFAVARMSEAGVRTIRVCTETTREGASRFYPAAGFVEVDRLGWWRPTR